MKKIFGTSIFWIIVLVAFRLYLRLFDSGTAQRVVHLFISPTATTATGEVHTGVQAQTIAEALDALSSNIDLAAAKITEKKQQETQTTQSQISTQIITSSTSTVVKLYYFNEKEDKILPVEQQANPQSLLPVFRTLPPTDDIIKDTMSLLLQGALMESEAKDGFTSAFIKVIRLVDVKLAADGTLSLTFEKAPNANIAGSAFIGILTNSLNKTALQFPQVKKVDLLPVELFQP